MLNTDTKPAPAGKTTISPCKEMVSQSPKRAFACKHVACLNTKFPPTCDQPNTYHHEHGKLGEHIVKLVP